MWAGDSAEELGLELVEASAENISRLTLDSSMTHGTVRILMIHQQLTRVVGLFVGCDGHNPNVVLCVEAN